MDALASALSDLLLEWEERRERGEPADPESICAIRPDLLTPFRQTVEKLLKWERLDRTRSTHLNPTPAEPARPSVAGFVMHERIGEGATSVVYRAEDVGTGLTVAVKVLQLSSLPSGEGACGLVQRFEQEARLLARLKHDGIVRIFLSRLQSTPPFFVMEYLPGGSLAEYAPLLRQRGPEAVTRFIEPIARAVGEAHRHKVLHRDLKPTNILLDAAGHPHVSDFGIAKFLDPEGDGNPPEAGLARTSPGPSGLTITDRQPGTLPYMAPEQYGRAFGQVGFATDVWALGVILYELLAGTRPFAAPEGAPRSAWGDCVCHTPAPPLQLGRRYRHLARVVVRCLEKNPARRYSDAGALADALLACTARGGRGWLWAAALLAGLMGLGAAATLPWPRPSPPVVEQVDPYRKSTEEAVAALGRGEAVDFVPRVRAGAYARSDDYLRVRECPDGFTVEYNGKWGLLEAMPHLPSGKYTLEAELRHDATAFSGAGQDVTFLGLYSWGSSQAAGRQAHHVIACLTFADRGPTTRYGARVVTYSLGRTFGGSEPFGTEDAVRYRPDPGGWRRLVWRLTPEVAEATFEGQPFPALTRGHFSQTAKDAARAGVAAQIRPDGAFGIYMSCGKLTVRRLRVVPDGK